jgi:hypothetical protein
MALLQLNTELTSTVQRLSERIDVLTVAMHKKVVEG